MYEIFSKNLAKYRKNAGWTQGQLAEKLNVTPQAVSKWENGSLPDSEFLPAIAQVLGISLDILFGMAEEREEPDLEQMLSDKIRQTPAKERANMIMRLFYAILSGYNDYKLSKVKYPVDLELETYAELKTDNELAIARLNDDLQYFGFIQIPENGINSYTEVSKEMSRLFELLSDEDAITILHYLGSGRKNRMQSLEMISNKSGVSLEKVEKIMERLTRFGIVWRVSAEISDDPPIIYGYVNSIPLTFLLTMAKSLTRYIRFHDMFIDMWKQGPFRMPNANVTPESQVDSRETEQEISNE